jgi:hypothetical protein
MEAPETLIARSAMECHLYIELHPCACGERQEPGRHRLESREAGLVAVYRMQCRRCGAARQLEFVMKVEIAPIGKFGGANPSQIVDAGEFLAIADAAARAVPADLGGLDDTARHRARLLMSRAVAAIEEVLKFIGLYGNEPNRFRRTRLQVVLRQYQDAVATL